MLRSAVQRPREQAHEASVDDLIAKPLALENLLVCFTTLAVAALARDNGH